MLVDVPEHYTLSSEETIAVLDELEIARDVGEPNRKRTLLLEAATRKLSLMDGYLHNKEQSVEEKGRPPYPTDENGSFEVKKP